MFNDFIKKYNLKNKATSNIKVQQILSSLSLNDIGIYLRDGPFEFDTGIVNLHPSKEHIGFYIFTETFLIHMGLHLQRNYLNLS